MSNLIDKLPALLSKRLRTRTGQQFTRFIVVAAAALAASEIALFIFGAMGLGGGTSGVCAGAVGALVSYILSRWAWRRKGRPDIRRETLPFWIVSAGAWLVLGLAAKLGHIIANSAAPAQSAKWYVIVGAVYFLGNCLTFVARFLIFHFLLFADRRGADDEMPGPVEEALSPIAAAVATADAEERQDRARRP
jgi:multisubunit Na+/H+ antiporter MnhB subunit